jgi:hypothetical protein
VNRSVTLLAFRQSSNYEISSVFLVPELYKITLFYVLFLSAVLSFGLELHHYILELKETKNVGEHVTTQQICDIAVAEKSPRAPKQSPRQRKAKRSAGFDD